MQRNKKVFLRKTQNQYLMKNICVAFTIIILIMPIYFNANNNVKKMVEKEQILHLSSGLWSIQSTIDECYSYAHDLSLNTYINRQAIANDGDEENALRIYNINKYKNAIKMYNPLIEDVLIQFANNKIILNQYTAYRDKETYYNNFFKYNTGSYSKWQDRVFTQSKLNSNCFDVWTNSLTDEKTLVMNYFYPKPENALIIISFIFIPEQELLQSILGEKVDNYSVVSLAFGHEPDTVSMIKDTGMESAEPIFFLESEYQNLSLEAYMSKEVYKSITKSNRNVLLIYIAIAVISAILLSFILARTNMSPLVAMIGLISQLGIKINENKNNAYAYISSALLRISNSKEHFMKEYELVSAPFKQLAFNSIIKGLKVDKSYLDYALGNTFEKNGEYMVICVSPIPASPQWEEDYSPNVALAVAKQLFIENTIDPVIFEFDSLFAILNVDSHGGKEALNNIIEKIYNVLTKRLGQNLCFGISLSFKNIEGLNDAVEQSIYMADYSRTMPFPHISQYESPLEVQYLPIHIDIEKLRHIMISDDKSEFEIYFDNIKQLINSQYLFKPLYCKTIYFSILAIYQDIISGLNSDIPILKDYDMKLSIQNNLGYLYNIGQHIIDLDIVNHQQKDTELTKRIMEYINDNYASPSLCLTMVADKFNYTERYVSNLIKKQTGNNYNQMLQDIRMNKAKMLLKDTHMTIHEIAISVGYDHSNSFYKYFKRVVGVSPKQYRTYNKTKKGSYISFE